MNICLTQIDGALPNIALMKLAHCHKSRGDDVFFTRDIEHDLFEPRYGKVGPPSALHHRTDDEPAAGIPEKPIRPARLSEDWLRLSDAAHEAGVTTGTLMKWAASGELKRWKAKNGWRYHREAVRSRARPYWKKPKFIAQCHRIGCWKNAPARNRLFGRKRTMITFRAIATCVGCGCTDVRACPDGCFWLRVDYAAGQGVCSCCERHVAQWDEQHGSAPAADDEHGISQHIEEPAAP